ncbi:hypothetical protein, partial [Xenorhabdus szentirmaii]|uniref:hypothetical protein n=1 Tax=Xenorhabdus szentirmaii TaxID=290112 RepID=UPI002B414862
APTGRHPGCGPVAGQACCAGCRHPARKRGQRVSPVCPVNEVGSARARGCCLSADTSGAPRGIPGQGAHNPP